MGHKLYSYYYIENQTLKELTDDLNFKLRSKEDDIDLLNKNLIDNAKKHNEEISELKGTFMIRL